MQFPQFLISETHYFDNSTEASAVSIVISLTAKLLSRNYCFVIIL